MMSNLANQLEMPLTGTIVNEDSELAQFADSCFYVLPSSIELSSDKVKGCIDELTSSKSSL